MPFRLMPTVEGGRGALTFKAGAGAMFGRMFWESVEAKSAWVPAKRSGGEPNAGESWVGSGTD